MKIVRSKNNYSKYIAIVLALILVTYLETFGTPKNGYGEPLSSILYIIYHILILLSIYYGCKNMFHLRKLSLKQRILCILCFIVNLVLVVFTILGLLIELLNIS